MTYEQDLTEYFSGLTPEERRRRLVGYSRCHHCAYCTTYLDHGRCVDRDILKKLVEEDNA